MLACYLFLFDCYLILFDCVEWCPKHCHYGLEEYPPPRKPLYDWFSAPSYFFLSFLNLRFPCGAQVCTPYVSVIRPRIKWQCSFLVLFWLSYLFYGNLFNRPLTPAPLPLVEGFLAVFVLPI